MTQPTQVTQGTLGNTSTRVRGRKWCFTWNNWDASGYDTVTQALSERKDVKYVIGKEVGEQGTPHLQGYLEYTNAVSFNSIKTLLPKAHIEKAKGSTEDNFKYCTKEGDFVTNIEHTLTPEELYEQEMREDYEGVTWKDWQQQVLDIIESKPDHRKVYWFWERKGNTGKSFLAKYIDWKYNAIIASGKSGDVFNQYKEYLCKAQPKVAIIDIPRTNKDYVCYGLMEKIKDGLAYSGKYEGGKLRICKHHLIVFANFAPDMEKLSEDRWHVVDISSR